MSNTTNGTPAAPVRRIAAEEEQDRDEVIKNLTSGAYLDWPNEAGFDNLTEHRGPIELPVKGTIPAWAAGSLFRNGPGARRIQGARSTNPGQPHDDGEILLSHWFDGLAHLHRFDMTVPAGDDDDDSNKVKVFYSSRRQADAFVERVREKGSFRDIITFAQKADPCMGIFAKAMSCFRAAAGGAGEALKYDNFNVTVLPAIDNVPGLFQPPAPSSGGHRRPDSKMMWIASDNAALGAVDASTLAPIGSGGGALQSALHPSLAGATSCAHAQRDPLTGDVFNYNLQGGGGPAGPTYRVFRVSAATGATDVLATISRPGLPMAYIHSFFLSARFVVLRVPSAHFGCMGLSVPWKGNLVEAVAPFDEAQLCRWFVVDRVHGQGVVAEFETPAAFFFHSVNCWDEIVSPGQTGTEGTEDVADIFCEVVDFPNTDILHKFYYDVMLNINDEAKKAYATESQIKNTMPSLVRWKFRVPLPTASGSPPRETTTPTIPEKVLSIPSPHAGELPSINPARRTRPHRYVYGLVQNGRSTLLDAIVKTDTATREALSWNNPAGHTPAEAIFVPRPGAEEEDDGVLLSVVLDGYSEKSYLLCLDAATMEELGRAEMDFAVGFGLHGVHVPQ